MRAEWIRLITAAARLPARRLPAAVSASAPVESSELQVRALLAYEIPVPKHIGC